MPGEDVSQNELNQNHDISAQNKQDILIEGYSAKLRDEIEGYSDKLKDEWNLIGVTPQLKQLQEDYDLEPRPDEQSSSNKNLEVKRWKFSFLY